MAKENNVNIEIVKGIEGDSLYINSFRVSGPKPWGGGQVIMSFEAPLEYIREAIGHLLVESVLDGENKDD